MIFASRADAPSPNKLSVWLIPASYIHRRATRVAAVDVLHMVEVDDPAIRHLHHDPRGPRMALTIFIKREV